EDTKLVFDETGGVHEVKNPDAGKPVLTNRRAILLADTARQLTRVFRSTKLDIEWVFAGDQLYIVQSRPYVTDKSARSTTGRRRAARSARDRRPPARRSCARGNRGRPG